MFSDALCRRSCQTVLAAVTKGMLSALAPMLPHLAEDAWQNLPEGYTGGLASVFLAGWQKPEPAWQGLDPELVSTAEALRGIRDHVNGVGRFLSQFLPLSKSARSVKNCIRSGVESGFVRQLIQVAQMETRVHCCLGLAIVMSLKNEVRGIQSLLRRDTQCPVRGKTIACSPRNASSCVQLDWRDAENDFVAARCWRRHARPRCWVLPSRQRWCCMLKMPSFALPWKPGTSSPTLLTPCASCSSSPR